MKAIQVILFAALLTGCASTYHLSENERSRTYPGYFEDVWSAAIQSMDDVDLAIVETEPEHGRIVARTGWTIWDLKGHVVMIVLSDTNYGTVRVDANAEAYSDDTVVDFGTSGRYVKRFLKALDKRMRTTAP